MYCPNCGQQQISDELRFCSRCGFTMQVVSELLKSDGVLTERAVETFKGQRSPRWKGVRQGMLLMFIGMVLVFMLTILHVTIGLPEIYAELSAGIFLFGGLMRMLYAVSFEEGEARKKKDQLSMTHAPVAEQLGTATCNPALPPAQGVAASEFIPQRIETAEMVERPSVTENTTKLLKGQVK